MLPDFPKLKSDISEHLMQFVQNQRDKYLAPFSEARRVCFPEGSGQRTVVRASGEVQRRAMQKISASFTLDNRALSQLTLDKILRKLDEVAQKQAQQMADYIYKTIRDTAIEVGNVVDGKQVTPPTEAILAALSRVQMDFSTAGKPRMPSMHVFHPDVEKAILRAFEEFDTNPELQKRFSRIMQNKKEEWRAREASRKLVG